MDEDIFWFDISVNDVVFSEMFQCESNLEEYTSCLAFRYATRMSIYEMLKCLLVAVFQHNVDARIC